MGSAAGSRPFTNPARYSMSHHSAVPQIRSEVPHVTNTCIWCLSSARSANVEHIIPESMGGPWVLPGNVVCKTCNQRLSSLDRALSDPFDFLTFVRGVQGKKGRRKKVVSRGNLIAEQEATGPTIRMNSSSGTVTLPDGRALSGRGTSARNVISTVRRLAGDSVAINLQVPFVFDRVATRGVVKIAFESLVWFLGAEHGLGPEYGAVRDYVLADIGERRCRWC